jgi:hypothetical protein
MSGNGGGSSTGWNRPGMGCNTVGPHQQQQQQQQRQQQQQQQSMPPPASMLHLTQQQLDEMVNRRAQELDRQRSSSRHHTSRSRRHEEKETTSKSRSQDRSRSRRRSRSSERSRSRDRGHSRDHDARRTQRELQRTKARTAAADDIKYWQHDGVRTLTIMREGHVHPWSGDLVKDAKNLPEKVMLSVDEHVMNITEEGCGQLLRLRKVDVTAVQPHRVGNTRYIDKIMLGLVGSFELWVSALESVVFLQIKNHIEMTVLKDMKRIAKDM